jgi:hypothetical protein
LMLKHLPPVNEHYRSATYAGCIIVQGAHYADCTLSSPCSPPKQKSQRRPRCCLWSAWCAP